MATYLMDPIQINIIVPLQGSKGEILVLDTGNEMRLPVGEIRTGELSFDAARRIARDQIGVGVRPLRLLYVVEHDGSSLSFSLLCDLGNDEGEPNAHAKFVTISALESHFEPAILREVLTEDSTSGFYRPTAHIVARTDASGAARIDINW